MFKHARHFPCSRRYSRNRHDRVPIDLEHFIRAIVNDGIAGGRTAIPGNEDAALKLEGQNCRGLRWNPRRIRGGS